MKAGLWDKIRGGDSGAMRMLYQDCYQDLYAYGFRILPDRQVVQDTLHELFAGIWLKRDTLGQVEFVDSYLKTSLRNNLIRESNKSKKFISIDDIPSLLTINEHSYEQLLIESQFIAERKDKISHAIDALTPTQREIVRLKFFDGMEYDAIARQLELKSRTVYNHVYAAICTLREKLLQKH
ncbi:RNA polymerase sigma factor [Pedobacter sp. BMA]|uniref:RNA polymerase sigma factor n=1 Tax=Pedobacter sp. BMA TaxID=1663685 RepID=UPI000649D71E|nr:sigma-70 family RNA polymerase sigma factor [Pedobacter sp. BMA]KLT64800.1 hypothetical protein AB669_13775 [Pedobacter sp. BMA]